MPSNAKNESPEGDYEEGEEESEAGQDIAQAASDGEAADKSAKDESGDAEIKPKSCLSISFGKRLAHTDKSVRDRGFKTMKMWIKQRQDQLVRSDFMKLWKGLYMGFWMADKRPIQQELAVNSALLINEVSADKRSDWIDAFWETMLLNWENLDAHRISKYLLFIRIIVAEHFKVLREAGWQEQDMSDAVDAYTSSIAVAGLKGANIEALGCLLHWIRLFWEEMEPQLEKKVAPKASMMAMLEPFCVLAERSPNDTLVKCIHEKIFRVAPETVHDMILERVTESLGCENLHRTRLEALHETVVLLGGTPDELPEAPKGPKLRWDKWKKKFVKVKSVKKRMLKLEKDGKLNRRSTMVKEGEKTSRNEERRVKGPAGEERRPTREEARAERKAQASGSKRISKRGAKRKERVSQGVSAAAGLKSAKKKMPASGLKAHKKIVSSGLKAQAKGPAADKKQKPSGLKTKTKRPAALKKQSPSGPKTKTKKVSK